MTVSEFDPLLVSVGIVTNSREKLGSGMLENEEDEAIATHRIVMVGTCQTVGVLYEWQDGSKQPLWFNGSKSEVVLIGLSAPVLSLADHVFEC